MVGWGIFAGVLLFLLGLFLLLRPALWWKLTESWKSYSSGDPSDFYLKVTKISGGVLLAVGAVMLAFCFILR